MLNQVSRRAFACGASAGSCSSKQFNVAVLGAAGGIGQPLSLLLAQSHKVGDLRLYDVSAVTPGVAADISHIDKPVKVSGYGKEDLDKALRGADVVVIPAGVPRKPGMTRDDLFNTNATIVQNLAAACARACPKAHLLIISNPVNSTVPIVAETLRKAGTYDPRRVFGVTSLDVVRANKFVAEAMNKPRLEQDVTVIGGHAGITILPLLSQIPGQKFDQDTIAKLTNRIQFGGDEVVAAKAGQGSATLSMAYAGARFTNRLLDAMAGNKNVVECTFVQSNVTDAEFFSSPITLGADGVEKINGYGKLSAFEEEIFNKMLPDLKAQIKKGKEFANK